jgi:cobalt/nickel transport system ATP-binding protein
MIQVENLNHRYGDQATLLDIGFLLAPGEKAVLLGANGCGKSTLLKILDGLIAPSEGRYLYDGEPITPLRLKAGGLRRRFRQEVALLFQNPDVMLFNPTVADEIAFGPRQLGLPDVADRVAHWAGQTGVTPLLQRTPFSLSGGEKQKVALAALLAVEPKLLLLDEPTAALDPRSTGWLVDFLAGLKQTVLCTTHNLSLAPELAPRALVLGEDHRLLFDGPIERFLSDEAGLIQANLAHIHSHRHTFFRAPSHHHHPLKKGVVEHRHFHTHDW